MKFITTLLTLFTTTFVYSIEIGIFKRAEEGLNVSPECQKDLDSSKEYVCLGINFKNTKNLRGDCEIIQSDICNKFYENPSNYFPKCKEEKTLKAITSKTTIEYLKANLNFACSTDGDGKVCPAADAALQGLTVNEHYIEKTCTSKKCIKALDDYLDLIINQGDNLKEDGIVHGNIELFKILKELLNNETCISKAKDDLKKESNMTSDGISTTKIANTILFVFVIILGYII